MKINYHGIEFWLKFMKWWHNWVFNKTSDIMRKKSDKRNLGEHAKSDKSLLAKPKRKAPIASVETKKPFKDIRFD